LAVSIAEARSRPACVEDMAREDEDGDRHGEINRNVNENGELDENSRGCEEEVDEEADGKIPNGVLGTVCIAKWTYINEDIGGDEETEDQEREK